MSWPIVKDMRGPVTASAPQQRAVVERLSPQQRESFARAKRVMVSPALDQLWFFFSGGEIRVEALGGR